MPTPSPRPASAAIGANADAKLRADLAAAFRWAVKLGWHEAVANHFSVMTGRDKRFLINPDQMHFARIRASDLIEIDADDPDTPNRPDAPDPTAWGLHGSLHRNLPHARCALHVHSKYATALAALADSRLPPVDQNSAMFFNRVAIDENYGGLAFEEEGERVCALFGDPRVKILVMGNHGVLAIGDTVAEAFNTLYYFERAAETYITALSTGRPLRVLSDEIAEKTAQEAGDYPSAAQAHLRELRLLLDAENADYAG